MKHRNNNMLLSIAQADACAIAVEYIDRAGHPTLYDDVLQFKAYQQKPRYEGLRPGKYSDDTEMSITNARALTMLVSDPAFGQPEPLATLLRTLYVEEFQHGGGRLGYSRRLQEILATCRNGADFKRLVIPDSTFNGAAMRNVPAGVLPLERLIEFSRVQAEITHATPHGIFSATAVALMSHHALYCHGPLSLAPLCAADEIRSRLPGAFPAEFLRTLIEPWDGRPVNGDVPEWPVSLTTVWAVAHLLRTETTLMNIMRRLIEWGGDTDSVAAIAWGIASARMQNEQLPAFLARDLEPDRPDLGPTRLVRIGTELMDAYAAT